MLAQPHAPRKTTNMRIHHNAFVHVEDIAQDNIGGLAGHASKREQLIHGARHFAIELFGYNSHAFMDGLGFVAPKVQRFHKGFNGRGGGFGKIVWRWKLGKQCGRSFVHSNICALCA